MNREIPEVGPEHLPGLIAAKKIARKYEDIHMLGFLIRVAQRKAAEQGGQK